MPSLRTSALLLALLCAVSFLPAAEEFAEIQAKVVSFKLDNGLTVILYRRGDAPVIACVTYVKVGSTDEQPGITGIAHQLEHLAFKGTPNIGTKDYAAEQAAFAGIDKLYAEIQSFEQELPAGAREGFQTLLAKSATTGSAAGADKTEQQAAALAAECEKAGQPLKDDRKAALLRYVQTFAERVRGAEQYVEQNQYANVIDRNGGTGLNAFTSADRTVYHVSLPANKLELWASLETDRYLNTVPRQIEKEKQVVLEERRMRSETSPFGKLYEAFLGKAFTVHPYGTPTIGRREDIIGYTRAKVLDFYRRHYVPENTIVAVTGDIDVEQTRKLLSDYFGRIPKSPAPDRQIPVEPAQDGERRVEVKFPAQPILLVGFHVPERNHPDTPALEVLDEVASSGRSSRLSTRLVKTGKANSAGCWLSPGARFPRLFIFSTEPPEGVALDDLEANLLAEIEKLKQEPPTAEEMKRVLTGYRAGVLRSLRSNLGLGMALADYQALSGDWHSLFHDIQLIGAVKPDQVTAAAAKYLTKQNRTVGRLVPLETAATPAGPDKVLGVPVK
ncbi:MAG: pitrilysin family protein [Planctomycetota bacterium]|nr:pitrilysin family protein [Planctomycetota bacterium]